MPIQIKMQRTRLDCHALRLAEPRAVAASLSNTPLKRLAHVPYREPFSDNKKEVNAVGFANGVTNSLHNSLFNSFDGSLNPVIYAHLL